MSNTITIIFILLAAAGAVLAVLFPIRVTIRVRRRRPEDIRSYLEGRDWYPAWKENLLAAGYDAEVEERFMSGKAMDDSIIGAFQWISTPQGYDFWEDKQAAFASWLSDTGQHAG